MLVAILASTKDLINGREYPGGPALYSTLALHYLGFEDFIVLTSKGITYNYLRKLSVNIMSSGVGETVFEVVLDGFRTLKLVSKSSIDLVGVTKHLSNDLLISLTMNEIPFNLIRELVRGRRVVIDIQGFIRDVGKDNVVFNNYLKFWELLNLECDELVIRGEAYEFPPECRGSKIINCIINSKTALVVTNGSEPIHFSRGNELGTLQPLQAIYGPTLGSGDVFTAILTYEYLILGKDLVEAIARASTAATLRLRGRVPWFTSNEVDVISSKVLKTYKRLTY